MKFVKMLLSNLKKEGAGESGIDWKRYKNLLKIDIFRTLMRPIKDMGNFVDLFINCVT